MKKIIPILAVLALIAFVSGRQAFSPRGHHDGSARRPAGNNPSQEPVTMGTSYGDTATKAVDVVSAMAQAPVAVGEVKRGTSFFDEMRKVGVSPLDIHDIVQASKKNFDFKKIRPGQKYSIFETTTGELDSLHFATNKGNILKVWRGAIGFESRLDTIPYRIEHFITTSTISSSIFVALQNQGANPELASYLAIIFQWDIDFFKDIRKGDTFTILYENKVFENGKRRLGNVLAARVHTRGQDHYAFAYRDKNDSRNYYDVRGKSLQKSLLRAPLRYSRISSNFTHKRLHPVTHSYKPHLGVDYVAPRGTPVRSTGDGTVIVATRVKANGNYVKIRHNNRYTTYYLHLQGFAKGIRKGRRVKQGQVIGYLGSTGLVTAAHLDYRIKVGNKFVNPRTIKLPSKRPVPKGEKLRFEITRDACLVRFFETNVAEPAGTTTLVRKPQSPLQNRMAEVF